jgi:hypothetical protein
MEEIKHKLEQWKSNLCLNINVVGLLSRNRIAYNHKALFRNWMIRECVCWRTHDLLSQAQLLFEKEHILGSRILIRSAIETMAVLVYLNLKTEQVVDNELNFIEYDQITRKLLLGSRNEPTKHSSINILSVLKHCDIKYPGIVGVYETLSENAHPNYEGICFGYSSVDFTNHEENFSNKWSYMWGEKHSPLMKLVIYVFETEYDDIWPELIKKIENWLEINDFKIQKQYKKT